MLSHGSSDEDKCNLISVFVRVLHGNDANKLSNEIGLQSSLIGNSSETTREN